MAMKNTKQPLGQQSPGCEPPQITAPVIDAVVIGRNEGDHLLACLASLKPQVQRLIYVDSGSSDSRFCTAIRAISAVFCETLVNLGTTRLASVISSKPTIDKSEGTSIPRSRATRRAPIAC